MKQRLLLSLLVICPIAIGQSSAPKERANKSSPVASNSCRLSATEEREVVALPGRYRDAWLQPDAQTMVMKLFTEESTILPAQGMDAVHGKTDITAWWWPPNSKPFEILEFTMPVRQVSGCGKMAYVWGLQTLKWRYTGEKSVTAQGGTYIMAFRKQANGRWLIDSFMWNDKPPEK